MKVPCAKQASLQIDGIKRYLMNNFNVFDIFICIYRHSSK
jgi:hypothetical protein